MIFTHSSKTMAKFNNVLHSLPRLFLHLLLVTASTAAGSILQADQTLTVQEVEELLAQGVQDDFRLLPTRTYTPRDSNFLVDTPDWGICPPTTAAQCKPYSVCYNHGSAEALCGDEDTIADVPQCKGASPICDACYPYSRCGDDSGHVPGYNPENFGCYDWYSSICPRWAKCYSHTEGCDETTRKFKDQNVCEGSYNSHGVNCEVCFPNSKCSSSYYEGPVQLTNCDVFDGLKRCWKTYVPDNVRSQPSQARHGPTRIHPRR